MKFWKKFKIKFKQNKRYRIYMVLGTIFQITAGLFFLFAFLQKDDLDNIDKSKDDKFKKELLKSSKNAEFNSECTKFFNDFNSTRFKRFYKYGYVVVKQYENDSLCKKSFGDTHYTDLSTFRIYEENGKHYFYQKAELVQNMFGQNISIHGNKVGSFDDTLIDLDALSRPQRIWGISMQVSPTLHLVNSVFIVKNTKPYIYIFGLIDKNQANKTLKKGVANRIKK